MTPLRGRNLILIFFTAIAVSAALGYFTLRKASYLRFAISIHMVPESPYRDLIELNRPVLVRIDKRSAGNSPLRAQAALLDGKGGLVAPLQPLVVKALPSGKRTEETVFPPLTTLPSQRLVATAVLRLPPPAWDDAAVLARLQHALSLGGRPDSTLPRVFSNVLAVCRELGGHAELTQIEVREKL